MDYKKHHDLLIAKRGNKEKPKDGGYYERHHILPRSLGGSDEEDNLTYLTGREHFMVHWLLYKIHGAGPMADAFYAMTMDKYGNRYAPNARLIEIAMKAKSDAHSDKYLKGEVDYSNMITLENFRGNSRIVCQSEEFKEKFKGTKSPVAKYIFDFYKGESIVHTGTYATFAKEFEEDYQRVYVNFKNKGYYGNVEICNKRENPDKMVAKRYDVIDYKTQKIVAESLTNREIYESFGVFKLGINKVMSGKQRQTKGYTLKISDKNKG
jgi:hypothetical protein